MKKRAVLPFLLILTLPLLVFSLNVNEVHAGWGSPEYPTNQWRIKYYDFTGTPSDPAGNQIGYIEIHSSWSFDFNWGTGQIGTSGKSDNVFAVAGGRWYFPSSTTYTFAIGSDDGSKLYIDGAEVINNWFDQGYTERSGSRSLSAGYHDIHIYYYERGGGAELSFNAPRGGITIQHLSVTPNPSSGGGLDSTTSQVIRYWQYPDVSMSANVRITNNRPFTYFGRWTHTTSSGAPTPSYSSGWCLIGPGGGTHGATISIAAIIPSGLGASIADFKRTTDTGASCDSFYLSAQFHYRQGILSATINLNPSTVPSGTPTAVTISGSITQSWSPYRPAVGFLVRILAAGSRIDPNNVYTNANGEYSYTYTFTITSDTKIEIYTYNSGNTLTTPIPYPFTMLRVGASQSTIYLYCLDDQYRGQDPSTKPQLSGSFRIRYMSGGAWREDYVNSGGNVKADQNTQFTAYYSTDPPGWYPASWWDDYGIGGQRYASYTTYNVGTYSVHKVAGFYCYRLTIYTDPSTAGSIAISGLSTYTHGQTAQVSPKSYMITANVPSGYTFDHWECYSGSISLSNAYANPSTMTVHSNDGWIRAHFRQSPVQITITSSPTGYGFVKVDGSTITTPQTYSWTIGSTHTLEAISPVSGGSGTQYVWTSWSDGGGRSHTYTTPSSSQTVTANFKTQYYLTMAANPSSGGSVSPSSGWRDADTSVQIHATTNSGWTFTSWTGSGSGSYSGSDNPRTITMNGPITETANFQQSTVSITITSNPTGSGFVGVDGNSITTPRTYSWIVGSTHTLEAVSPVSGGTGIQYIWTSWSDGGARTHTYTVPSSPQTATANYKVQYQLTMQANPAGGGSTNPSVGTHWYDSGSSVQIQATPNSGYVFTSWSGSGSGSYTGPSNPRTITINGPIIETANFQRKYTVTVFTGKTDGSAITGVQVTLDSVTKITGSDGRTQFTDVSSGTHTLSLQNVVSGGAGVQYVFEQWSDGGTQNPRTIDVSSDVTFNARYETQYYLTMQVNPSGGGSTSPQSGWQDSGDVLSISANPASGYTFSSWTGSGSGSYTGTSNPASVTMNGLITETANFQESPLSVSVNPNSGTVSPGGETTATVSISGPWGSQVSLSSSGQPSGVDITFNPASGNSPFDSTMTISVGLLATPNTYPITIRAVGGAISRETVYTLTITQLSSEFEFGVYVSPPEHKAARGGAVSYSVTALLLSGTSESVSLSIYGLDTTMSASFTPPSGKPTYTSTLTVNVGSLAPLGTYKLVVTGQGGGKTRTAEVTLEVLEYPPPGFSVRTNPAAAKVKHGGSIDITTYVAFYGGYSQTVSLSALNLPSGVAVNFNPASGSSSFQSTTIINVAASTTPGTYVIEIKGTDGDGKTASSYFTLMVEFTTATPDFLISVNPSSITAVIPHSGTVSDSAYVTAISINGFSGDIAFSLQNLPSGVSGEFNPTLVSLAAGDQASSALTLTVSSTVQAGKHIVRVVGTSSLTRISEFTLILVAGAVGSSFDFSVSVSPSEGTIPQGGSGSATVTVSSVSGTAEPVSLSASGAPSGVGIKFNPSQVSPTGTSIMSIQVGGGVTEGDYIITVTGEDGGKTRTATYTLTVGEESSGAIEFLVFASPSEQGIQPGESTQFTVTVTLLYGTPQSVKMSATGLPTGATPTFSPDSGILTFTTTLTISTGLTVAEGEYSVTIKGTAGSKAGQCEVMLKIAKDLGPDFTLRTNPAAAKVDPGTHTTASTIVSFLRGYSYSVTLTVENLPSGVTVQFNPPTASSSFISTTTINVAGTVQPGSYALRIKGSGGDEKTHSAYFLLIVKTVGTDPDFYLQVYPSSIATFIPSFEAASKAATVRIFSVNGFSGGVNLSASGTPIGVLAEFTPTSVTFPDVNQSTLTIRIQSTATPGSYVMKVTGRSGVTDRVCDLVLTLSNTPAGEEVVIVEITEPADGATVSGVFELKANVTDIPFGPGMVNASYKVSKVGWESDWLPMTPPSTGTIWTASVDPIVFESGVALYNITVEGRSKNDPSITGTDRITITIDNTGVTHLETFYVNYAEGKKWYEEDHFTPGETLGVRYTLPSEYWGRTDYSAQIQVPDALVYPPLKTTYPTTLTYETIPSDGKVEAEFPLDFSFSVYGDKVATVTVTEDETGQTAFSTTLPFKVEGPISEWSVRHGLSSAEVILQLEWSNGKKVLHRTDTFEVKSKLGATSVAVSGKVNDQGTILTNVPYFDWSGFPLFKAYYAGSGVALMQDATTPVEKTHKYNVLAVSYTVKGSEFLETVNLRFTTKYPPTRSLDAYVFLDISTGDWILSTSQGGALSRTIDIKNEDGSRPQEWVIQVWAYGVQAPEDMIVANQWSNLLIDREKISASITIQSIGFSAGQMRLEASLTGDTMWMDMHSVQARVIARDSGYKVVGQISQQIDILHGEAETYAWTINGNFQRGRTYTIQIILTYLPTGWNIATVEQQKIA